MPRPFTRRLARRSPAPGLLLSLFAAAHCAHAQVTLFTLEDSAPNVWLGNSVAELGDLSGDGVGDFAVSGIAGDVGIVRVFSGVDGQEFFTIESADPGASFGEDRNVVGVGDLDGDGAGEIAVSTPWGTAFVEEGFLEIFRGADGSFLRSHLGVGPDSLGSEVAALGDVDGDGIPDYAACNFERADEGGYTAIYSGAGGEELARLTSTEPLRFYSIAGPGDLNNDGRGDLALGLWSEIDPWRRGQVRVLSGALFGTPSSPAGTLDLDSPAARAGTLLEVDGRSGAEAPPNGFEALGMGVDRLGDVDGDGVPDVGAGTGPSDDAVILSGADGTRIQECLSDDFKLLDQYFVETAGIGDLDGDGVRDVAVGRVGVVKVISGKDGSVLAESTGTDGFGEEIAAIGDLNGDGISEVVTSSPGGEYALVLDFAQKPPIDANALSEFAVVRQGGTTVVTWKRGLTDAVLEQSGNLIDWEPVDDLVFENFYLAPATGPSQLYYRLRFTP